MSLRFSFTLDKAKTARRYGLPVKEMPEANYNISPDHNIIAITIQNPHSLTHLKWGLTFKKKPSYLITTSNFKINPYKNLLFNKRCLIPADGFYVWKKVSKKSLIPYRASLKWNLPFAFAGIYNEWLDENEVLHQGCAIINVPSNELISPFIKNSPLILPLEKENIWLNNELKLPEITEMLTAYPAEKMKIFPVSSLINDPDFNSPLLFEAVDNATDQSGNYILFTE